MQQPAAGIRVRKVSQLNNLLDWISCSCSNPEGCSAATSLSPGSQAQQPWQLCDLLPMLLMT